MWDIAAVRWDYERDGELFTYYVTEDDANKILKIKNEVIYMICMGG